MHFTYGAITLWGAASQQLPLYRRFVTLYVQVRCSHLTTPASEDAGLGLSLFARRYWGNHSYSLFLRVLRCFTSPGSLSPALPGEYPLNADEFPHSEISGSQATNRLPEAYRRLIASFIAVLGQGIHRALLAVSHAEHCMPQSLLSAAALVAQRSFLYLFAFPAPFRLTGTGGVSVCQRVPCLLRKTRTAPHGAVRV